ncbi:rhodanese-like domain-containing protein [Halorubrum ezzemoulense]|uniref:Rhodanese-like domain-containing protein n=1 Tax=Halorubrum ezzemoulense TaxID=337243 RepID=A0A256KTV0_HALEZ|nr:rhodanese-like domain-containing protein [Halorubrum ezzemoulense]OYR84614.1 thiosulfate sulfurtransferase [Halorubrum ezzemoulense]QAY21267.1 rhodanese-like domain-containing protein [Halorubrum ezzemoulense]
MSRIRPDELDERLGTDDEPFLLDIRPESDYRSGAIDGSRNVPVYDDLRSGDDAALRRRLDEIPDDSEVVTVCKMGIVAKRATRVLDEAGYEASTLFGGMSGWNGYERDSLGYKLRSLWWRLRG